MSFRNNSFFRRMYSKSQWLQYVWMKYHWHKAQRKLRINDVDFLRERFKNIKGYPLDLNSPVTFDERLHLYKLSCRDPLVTVCSDKIKVMDYVKQCGLEDILIPHYAVYSRAEEVDFDNLPYPCYIKCNHLSGFNTVYYKDRPFNRKAFIRKYNFLLDHNYYIWTREWNSKNIPTGLLCEKKLECSNPDKKFLEYNIYCFNGIPKFVRVVTDDADEYGNRSDSPCLSLDISGEPVEAQNDCQTIPKDAFELSPNYKEMLQIAAKLATPFRFVRVDLLDVDSKIFFSEMTFDPCGGILGLEPREWDERLGSYFDISGLKIAPDAYSTDPERAKVLHYKD